MAPFRLDFPVRVAESLPVLGVEDALPNPYPDNAATVLLPLVRWREERLDLIDAGLSVGVWLASTEGPEDWGLTLAEDMARLPVIGLAFPAFTDGRAYTTARLLRERHGFGGELRALGDVKIDQVPLMARCGFDAIDPKGDPKGALTEEAVTKALSRFRHVYQHAGDGRPALWAERRSTGALKDTKRRSTDALKETVA
ncbi:MAG: DUF934 domain-containing protein [Rhodospirillum sp.]|nr:DUF934 domain-containing protein [Rhodospirillum sp.]MCF8488514.1 DUF934 domain-containing protein [Rhodospirillum sp.]MCF8499259.1 DUF934 domain-containing protein [Rhodospirillum sp.]